MNVLSIDCHLSSNSALKYGRMRIAVKRKTRQKSSRISALRESFGRETKLVCLGIDGRSVAVAPLQTVELILMDEARAMQHVAQQQPQDGEPVACAGEERSR